MFKKKILSAARGPQFADPVLVNVFSSSNVLVNVNVLNLPLKKHLLLSDFLH